MLTDYEKQKILTIGFVVDHMLDYVRKCMADYDNLTEKQLKCLKDITAMSVHGQRNYLIIDDELVVAKQKHTVYGRNTATGEWLEVPQRANAMPLNVTPKQARRYKTS